MPPIAAGERKKGRRGRGGREREERRKGELLQIHSFSVALGKAVKVRPVLDGKISHKSCYGILEGE